MSSDSHPAFLNHSIFELEVPQNHLGHPTPIYQRANQDKVWPSHPQGIHSLHQNPAPNWCAERLSAAFLTSGDFRFLMCQDSESASRSVTSVSLQPHELYSSWTSPGQNPGVGSLALLQEIFPTQGLNPGLLHCRQFLYQLSYQGSPIGRPISFIIVHKSMVFLDVSADLS